jgi:hypothetical protein
MALLLLPGEVLDVHPTQGGRVEDVAFALTQDIGCAIVRIE